MTWTDDKVKKFWDYESNFKENYFTYQVGDKVVSYLEKYLVNRSKILDYGCGSGYLVKHLLNLKSDIYGLDFSLDSVAKTNSSYKETTNYKGACTLDALEKIGVSFDCIIATEVIEHLDDSKLVFMMQWIKQNLNSNGVGVFTTPNDEDLSKSMVYCPQSDVVFHRWQHVRSWSQETLRVFLLKYFDNVEIMTTNFSQKTSFMGLLKQKLKRLLGRHESVTHPHLIAVVSK